MRALTIVVGSFVWLAAYAGAASGKSMSPSYESAIADAQVTEANDRRVELRSCVRHWESLTQTRDALFAELDARKDDKLSLVLEIGNSAFQRYDYVIVTGNSLRTTFGRKGRVLSATVIRRFLDLLEGDVGNLRGAAESQIDDGDCYFLTIRMGATSRQVAIYGSAGPTVAGRVIAKLLSLADQDAPRR